MLSLDAHNVTSHCAIYDHMKQPEVDYYAHLPISKQHIMHMMFEMLLPTRQSQTADSTPRCCHLESYFKHTSFSCRYMSRDIMCKHDVMNIHHAHHPLWPGKSWQREVPCIHCLQWVFLHAINSQTRCSSWCPSNSVKALKALVMPVTL